MRFETDTQLGVLLLLCLLSRLPQLLSGAYTLDGDEAVVGLMAKHLAQGKEFPLYFYGQNYGFSLIEAGTIAPLYLLWGPSALALKLAMLTLWSAGIGFLFLAMRQMAPARKNLAFGLCLLMIANPAWAIWSMKARGGYLTAFLAWSVVLYLLFNQSLQARWYTHVLVGVLCLLIVEAQPLWIPGLLLFLLYQWTRSEYRWLILISLVAFLLGKVAIILAGSHANQSFWPSHEWAFDANPLQALRFAPIRVFEHFTGAYSYETAEKIPLALQIFAIFGTVATFFAIALIPFGITNGNAEKLTLGASVLAAVVCGCLGATHAPRYLLPVTGSLLVGFCLAYASSPPRRWCNGLLAVSIALGLTGVYQMKLVRVDRGTLSGLKQLIDYLDAKGIRAVYSHDRLLQWQLMFLSDEKIVSRFIYRNDRQPAYVKRADAILASDASHAAEVGYWDDTDFGGQFVARVDEFIVMAPTNRQRLEKLGYQF